MRGGGGGLRGDAFWICLTSGEGASGGSRRGGGGGLCCRGDGVAGGGGLRGDAFGGGGGFFLGDAAGALVTSGDAVTTRRMSGDTASGETRFTSGDAAAGGGGGGLVSSGVFCGYSVAPLIVWSRLAFCCRLWPAYRARPPLRPPRISKFQSQSWLSRPPAVGALGTGEPA